MVRILHNYSCGFPVMAKSVFEMKIVQFFLCHCYEVFLTKTILYNSLNEAKLIFHFV